MKIVLTGLLGSVLCAHAVVRADDLNGPSSVKADSLALFALFGGQPLAENSEAVMKRVFALPQKQRFDALAAWVLPGANHSDLRLTGHFVDPGDQTQAVNRVRIPGQRGSLRSPAIALVDAAAGTGRIEELKVALESLESKLASQQQRRAYAALQFLIDVARADDAGAVESLARLFDLFAATTPQSIEDRWPEMVAVECALGAAVARSIAAELLARMFELLVDDTGGWRTRATPEWTAHFLRQLAKVESEEEVAATAGGQVVNWMPATLEKARTAGVRLPNAVWRVDTKRERQVSRTTAHEDDLLFYACPLVGDFEVECDLKPYVWYSMQLLVGGQSLAPDGDRLGLDIRGIRASDVRHVGLPRQLAVSDEWAHARAVIRGDECRLYFDGRLIETRHVDLTSLPWLALRNPVPHRGVVRDVRISGRPTVPREIPLAADENLAGWFSCFEHDDAAWRQNVDWPRERGIERERVSELSGSAVESLLQYYRPMLEDGTITYEFFHQPGRFDVHPAVGRTAVLLQPDGVALHRVTCGKYEQTDLSPDNSARPDRDSTVAMPLRSDDWNQVSVTVSGDNLRVTLNDDVVYEGAIDSSEQRTFGLFHFADQTGVRVRNVVWRGDWPGSVPEVASQELADQTVSMLERSARRLTASFEHDFAKSGLPRNLFLVQGSDQQSLVEERKDGVKVTRPMREKGYADAVLAVRMRVYGDFDIEATFDGFSCQSPDEGWQGINLEVVPEDEGFTHCRVFRGTFVNSDRRVTDLCQAQVHRRLNGQYRAQVYGNAPEETSSGRLRVARRGDRVFFLLAEQDSTQLRILHEETVSDAGLLLDGIRLRLNAVSETDREAKHSVVWKRMSVRAESISDLPITNQKQVVAELDRHRAQLSDRIGGRIDGKADWKRDRWSSGTVSSGGDDGLRVVGVGNDQWTSSRVGFLEGVSGDFDVSATFMPTVFDDPAEGQNSTIYLRGTIPADERTSVDVILVRHPDGRQTALAEFVTYSRSGLKFRDVGVRDVKSVERLRLVRRGTKMTFLFAEKASDEYQVLAQTEVPPGDLKPQSFRFEVHAGGDGKRAVVNLKEFTLRADKLMNRPRGGTSRKRGGT